MTDNDPPRSADLPPGYDEDDPYEDEDVSNLPDWWQRNIDLLETHEMRPYRPPRFTDGEYTPEIAHELEDEFDVRIQIQCVNPQKGNIWEICVDGEVVETIDRQRHAKGYSIYDISSSRFVALIRETVRQIRRR